MAWTLRSNSAIFLANGNPGPNYPANMPSFLPQDGLASISSMISAWCGGNYDTLRHQVVLLRGGGHGDWAGNQVISYDFDTNGPWIYRSAISMAYARYSNDVFIDPVTNPYSDGSPSSVHSYGGSCYLPTVDRHWSSGGVYWSTGESSPPKTWWWDPNSAFAEGIPTGWTPKATRPGGFGISTKWDSTINRLYGIYNGGCFRYDPANDTYAGLFSGNAKNSEASDLALDVVGRFGYHFTRQTSGFTIRRFPLDPPSGETQIPTTGDTAIMSLQGVGMFFHNGLVYALGRTAAGTNAAVHTWNPTTGVWSRLDVTGTLPPVPSSAGIWGRFFLNPVTGDAEYVATTGIWTFDIGGAPPPSPPPPPSDVLIEVVTGLTVTVETIESPPSPPPHDLDFAVGAQIEVSSTTGTYVRPGAGASFTPLGVQPLGARGIIVGGTGEIIDNQAWWQIDYDTSFDGWSYETGLTVLTAPPPPPPPPAMFEIGARIEVSQASGLYVRSGPDGSLTPIGVQPVGAQGTLIGGPVPSGSSILWQVDYDTGLDGWSTEHGMSLVLPPTFVIGAPVQAIPVNLGDPHINVRAAPGFSQTLLGTQLVGATGVISGGTGAVVDGFAWWEVNWATGVDGWSTQNALTTNVAPPPPSDTIPPAVTITNPPATTPPATVSGTVVIQYTATDVNGIASVVIQVDGVTLPTASWDTTTHANASATIRVAATDPSGNVGSDSNLVTVNNVGTPPPPSGEIAFNTWILYPGPTGILTGRVAKHHRILHNPQTGRALIVLGDRYESTAGCNAIQELDYVTGLTTLIKGNCVAAPDYLPEFFDNCGTWYNPQNHTIGVYYGFAAGVATSSNPLSYQYQPGSDLSCQARIFCHRSYITDSHVLMADYYFDLATRKWFPSPWPSRGPYGTGGGSLGISKAFYHAPTHRVYSLRDGGNIIILDLNTNAFVSQGTRVLPPTGSFERFLISGARVNRSDCLFVGDELYAWSNQGNGTFNGVSTPRSGLISWNRVTGAVHAYAVPQTFPYLVIDDGGELGLIYDPNAQRLLHPAQGGETGNIHAFYAFDPVTKLWDTPRDFPDVPHSPDGSSVNHLKQTGNASFWNPHFQCLAIHGRILTGPGHSSTDVQHHFWLYRYAP